MKKENQMKKNYVRQEDYDFYSIRLPLKVAVSRRRKSFILRELEKIHPKVSSSCFVKSWLHFKKGKIQADVAVMEKSLLARYKNRFPGSPLYLPEKRQNPISGSKKVSFFVSAVLVLAAGFFGGKILLDVFSVHKKSSENILIAEDEVPAGAALPVLLAPSKLISAVFSSVGKSGGRLTSFSYNRGICTFGISGCDVEDVAEAQYCVVSYKDNRPQFTLSVPVSTENRILDFQEDEGIFGRNQNHQNYQNGDNLYQFQQILYQNSLKNNLDENAGILPQTDYQNSVKKVRAEIFHLGGNIQKEHVTENHAEFEFSAPEELFFTALHVAGTEAKNLGWTEKSFSVEKSGNQNHVKVTFLRENEGRKFEPEFSAMLLTASYAWLFKSKETETLKLAPKPKPVFKKAGSLAEIAGKTKLGEIKRNDGFKYIYYKNQSGKISCEKIAM